MFAASCLASSSSHSSYSVRNPSPSTWISRPAMVVTGMAASLLDLRLVLAGHGHVGRKRDAVTGQQDIPVHPSERQLPEVVERRLVKQSERAHLGQRVAARQRLDVVV